MSDPAAGGSMPSTYKRRRALLAYQRRHRRGAAGNTMTAADQLELENTIRDSILEILLNKSIPLWAWLIWILLGTIFYVYYDGYDWMIGFYICVNIGCAVGWGAPYDTPRHNDAWSKIFSSIHVTIGQIFVGIAVLYIAEQLMEDKDSWIISILQKKSQQNQQLTWWSKLRAKLSKLKILLILLIWIGIGIIFGALAVDGWDVADGVDFVLSTLTKCGYRKIPDNSASWKFLFVGFYSLFGIPLTIITLGIVVSFALAGSEERALFENIMVAVTPQELEVMRSVGIGVGENVIQKQDFIVLMVVRIGAAHPDVIVKINERFKTLDRKKLGKISYDDIVFRGKDIMRSKSETIRKLLTRRVSTMKRQSIISLPAQILNNSTFGVGIRNTFYRATKRASSIFPSMQFGPLSRPVDIDDQYQVSEGDEDSEDREESESTPSTPRSTSKSMSKFQLSLSHSISRVATLPNSSEELSPAQESKEAEVRPFSIINNQADCDHNIEDLETISQHSEQLDRIQEEAMSSSESESENEAQIKPESGDSKDQSDDEEAEDKFSNDPQSHFRERRKPVRISRALRHQLEIKKEKELLATMNIRDGNLFFKLKEYILLRLRHSHFILVIAWMFWLLEGALFYTVTGTTSFLRGFFLSVTVGYSLFWEEPENNAITKAFSVCHLLIGAVLISCSLSIIARQVVESKKLWYVEAIRKQAVLQALETEGIWDDIVALLQYWVPKLYIPVLFIGWEIFGIVWSCIFVRWSFADALYFVASGLTGGGMWLIPDDSPAWYYFFTAVYVTLGAPLMAIALGQFADLLINMAPNYDLEEQMKARVTDEELDTMKACGMENGDGFIDASEFVILILVRIHAVNPELISVIEERFADLDADNSGTLSYDELTLRTNQVLGSDQHRLSIIEDKPHVPV